MVIGMTIKKFGLMLSDGLRLTIVEKYFLLAVRA